MTRSLDSASFRKSSRSEGRIAASTGRAVGAALACLMVASLVVERSISAVQPDGGLSELAFSSAMIELSDDDQGRSLMNLANMVPGDPQASCININYNGSLFPIELMMTVDAVGELADYVEMSVVHGTGGEFGDCRDFQADAEIYSGPLSGLTRQEFVVATLVSSRETRSFRFEYQLADTADAMAKTASASIVWEVRPS